ncbi:MAG: PilN domain-containing protein [Bdellovibrionota bacterium]
MIRLNLLGEDPGIDKTTLKLLGGFFGSIIIFIATFAFLLSSINTQISEMSLQIETFENQLVDLRKKTQVVENLEAKRDELNSKLSIIAELKQNKLGPVRVLDDLNIALPDKAWISSMQEKSQGMEIVGFALDNQTIALFMKDLERSGYFKRVDLVETKQADNQGARVKLFTLLADITYAGTLAIEASEAEENKADSKQGENLG